NADAGWIFKKGAIDFAGGTVVHINAGIAGLVGALLIGKRVGYGRELMAPHSLTMSMIGASLLWVGWFGFNAGSNLEASGGAALGTGFRVMPAPSGAGIMDSTTGKIAAYDLVAQMSWQRWGVLTSLVWSGVGWAILCRVVAVIVALRANVQSEREGLDITEHT